MRRTKCPHCGKPIEPINDPLDGFVRGLVWITGLLALTGLWAAWRLFT